MDDRDAGKQRRRTWVIGGILLVLSAVATVVARGPLGGIHYAKDVLWALGAIVLIVGIGRAGSITRRRPVATVVTLLQVLVASPLVAWNVSRLVLNDPANPHAEEDSWASVFIPYHGIVIVLTVAAVVMIGFAGAFPRPWSWAPSWVLVWSSGAGFVSLMLFASAPLGSPIASAGALGGLVAGAAGTAFLGILAVVLGMRATRVEVTP